MNTSESNESDENESIETSSSPIEVRNLDMDVSFLHYEIEEDKYMEYLNKLEEKELIIYDYFEVALSETRIMQIKEIKKLLTQAKVKTSKYMFVSEYS